LDYPEEHMEIIVVNDGSTDRTVEKVQEIIAAYPHRTITLINQENKGKGAALNTALHHSRGEYFICMDADSTIERNALRVMLPYFSSDDVAVVLPCLKVEDRKTNNILQKMQRYEYLVSMFYKELMSRLDCIRVAPGPFSMYKKEIVEQVGRFDEHNLTEDLEMAIRLQKHHYKLIQTFKTNVYTIAPRTFRGIYRQRNRWYKGSFLNTIRYRGMIFNKTFGDFGMMQMPITLFSGFFTLSIIGFLIYRSIEPVFRRIHFWNLIDFDIVPLFKTFHWNVLPIDLNYSVIIVGVILGVFSLFVLKRAHSLTGERILKYGMVPLVCYMFMYFFILGVVWIGVAFDLLRKKQQRW
jgi:cellulose synthase/poly-beta-1,6-N-acetylglucosamine synthase-like glycosyltransferase